MELRDPSSDELRLIRLMVSKASKIHLPVDWEKKIQVSSFNDGEMGGILLFPDGTRAGERKFGRQASEFQFTDRDGVVVIVSLNLDQDEHLFELDVWKTDFSALIDLKFREP
ncbi:MAG: hypothetical protein JNN30_15330 [Rhodanobacteraceae bacterium]|nr:hypothetical protein [Rhodanobacteraceae bacterium]